MNNIATVKDLIEHLEANFKSTDRLCFFEEGGAWCELVHVLKSFAGEPSRMFNRVKDQKQHELGCIEHMKEEDRKEAIKAVNYNYRLVDDGIILY